MLSFEIVHRERDRFMYAERAETDWSIRSRIGHDRRNYRHDDADVAVSFLAFITGGYDRFVLYLEDTILICPEPGTLMAVDVISAITHRVNNVPSDVVEAICILALAGDEANVEEKTSEYYYEVVKEIMTDWPKMCSPIP